MRLRLFGIVGGGFLVDEILDTCDSFVGEEFGGLRGGGERNPLSVDADAFEELTHGRKAPHLGQIFFLEELAAVGLDLLPTCVDLLLREEHRQELITALADLRAHRREVNRVADMRQCFLPGLGMEVDRINQGAVDVEDDRSNQFGFPHLTLRAEYHARCKQTPAPEWSLVSG